MADGPKIIEFRSSDSGSGGSGGTSLVPVGSNGLTTQQQEEIKQFGTLLDRQADEYARVYGQFFDEFLKFFTASAEKAKQAEKDVIEGVFSVGGDSGGGGGNDPPLNDPFSFMDEDDGRFFTDDVKKWLDELEEEYKTQAELLERSNQAYDELTEQADSLVEAEEDFSVNLISLGSVAGLTTTAFLGLITAGLAFNRVVNELVEAVGGFSADVVQASMRSRLQEIEDRLQLASQAGGVIADLENTRSDLASELRQIMREAIELFGPGINEIAKELTTGMRIVRKFMENADNFSPDGWFSNILGLLSPPMGILMDELVRIRKEIEKENKPEGVDALNRTLDALFDPGNIWPDDDDGAMDMPGGAPRGRLPNGRGF